MLSLLFLLSPTHTCTQAHTDTYTDSELGISSESKNLFDRLHNFETIKQCFLKNFPRKLLYAKTTTADSMRTLLFL